jgi:uncharacterized protein YndB with AHSA1/START domain
MMSVAKKTPPSLIVERIFPQPVEKLWRALTERALLAEWMMKNDFEPVAGHSFQFRAAPMPNWDGIVNCEVLSVEPFKQLSYVWGVGFDSDLQWVVEWTLIADGGRTRVRMEQSGFKPHQTALYHGAKLGWRRFFDGLTLLLRDGAV